jgi:L-ascorbate metabolism protein UlaG (beta-lactamase superfamily)
MHSKLKWFAAAVLVLCLNIIPVIGEEQNCKSKSAAETATTVVGTKTASELLGGVVHLSDDDIRFRTKEGICVFVDPVNGFDSKLVTESVMTKPDLILITHSHEDHFQPEVIQGYLKLNPKAIVACPPDAAQKAQAKGINDVKVVKPLQKYTLAGIEFSTVPAYFTEGNSHPKTNQWVGYVLQIDGARYYVTGDTGPVPQMTSVKADVVFPLLSGCGGNLDEAIKMTYMSKARIAVPVHHSGQIEAINKYLAKVPKGIQSGYYKDDKLILTQ